MATAHRARPEHVAPASLYYSSSEASRYARSSRVQHVQRSLSIRALELLSLSEVSPCLILDIGCGTGLSGEIVQEAGHYWIGVDIAEAMLERAQRDQMETINNDGELLQWDMGHGLPFKNASFDGIISISALQWLLEADCTEHQPIQRIRRLFTAMFACLKRGARAVIHFYPENVHATQMIVEQAKWAGFAGGLVIDRPNEKRNTKYFLCLQAGRADDKVDADVKKTQIMKSMKKNKDTQLKWEDR